MDSKEKSFLDSPRPSDRLWLVTVHTGKKKWELIMPGLSGWVIVGRHGGGRWRRVGRADKDGLGVDMGPVAEGCSSIGSHCLEDS